MLKAEPGSGHKKRRRAPLVPTHNTPSHATSRAASSTSSTSSANRPPASTGSSRSGSSSGSGGGGSMSSAEARAVARENAAKHDAANRYAEQARNLEGQARALRHALNVDFGHALHIKLAGVNESIRDQNAVLMDGYRKRVAQLAGSVADNEKAAAEQTGINTGNLLRERDNAMTQAMAQGAGESDLLRSQMMSLRNWNANQAEVTRDYFDTLRSTNQSLTDLNVDTKTARMNNEIQGNADKEQLWTNYFNQRSETYTQLGNVRGQQADYYASAKEMGGKGDGGRAKKGAAGAFMAASHAAGQAWRNPGVSDKLKHWQGHDQFEATANNAARLEAAPAVDLAAKHPEGATLRKWAG